MELELFVTPFDRFSYRDNSFIVPLLRSCRKIMTSKVWDRQLEARDTACKRRPCKCSAENLLCSGAVPPYFFSDNTQNVSSRGTCRRERESVRNINIPKLERFGHFPLPQECIYTCFMKLCHVCHIQTPPKLSFIGVTCSQINVNWI